MKFIHLIATSFQEFPKSALLVIVALVSLWWIFHIIVVRKNYYKNIYKVYFCHAIFVLLWVISNAYFQSAFLSEFSPGIAKWMALFANITACFAIAAFYSLSCIFLDSKSKIIRSVQKFWTIFIIIETLVLNFIPNATVASVEVFGDGRFEIVFGDLNSLFFLLATITMMMGIVQFGVAVLREIQKKTPNIGVMKFYYIAFGMNVMYCSAIIFHVILPHFFQNFNFVWIPGVLSITDVLISGYAILVKRFINIPYKIGFILKRSGAIIVSSLYVYTAYKIYISLEFSVLYFIIFSCVGSVLIYQFFLTSLASRIFHRIFGVTNVQFFLNSLQKIQSQDKLYTSTQDLTEDLKELFCKELGIDFIKLELQKDDSDILRIYSLLPQDIRKENVVLATKEIRFLQDHKNQNTSLVRRLSEHGEVYISINNVSGKLIGVLVLGNKPYNYLYYLEELTALEKFSKFLSLTLTGILYNSELQTQVAEKTQSLTKALNEQNEILRQQSDFLSLTAHELRTPLSIVSAQAEEFHDELKEDPHWKEEVEILQDSVQRLLKTTKRLFDVQLYDSGDVPMHIAPVHAHQLLTDIHTIHQPLMKEKNIRFTLHNTISETLKLPLDLEKIQQLFTEILHNAIRYTPQDGTIHLSATPSSSTLLISVHDSGPGVPDADRENIFRRFRVNSVTECPGTGIGLSICQKIAHLHNAKIWVQESSQFAGAQFCLQIPLPPSSDS